MEIDTRPDDDRLARERAFHNARFEEGDNRQVQLKYYWAIAEGAERYVETVARLAAGKDVLEYGCADGSFARRLAPEARSVAAIDISDAAIRNAAAGCDAPNVRFAVMDAMNMDFRGGSFDLVFGSGIVHHLATADCAREVSRVLRPGGTALFWEPLGLNPAINLYRYLTPSARTPDEHPLLLADFRILREHFASVSVQRYGLTTFLALPFRAKPMGAVLRSALGKLDAALTAMPGVRELAWYALITCQKA